MSSKITRREFVQVASASSVLAATAPTVMAATVKLRPNEKGPFDLVITGGRVIDPETGLDAVRNVGIKVPVS